jgi:folate-binding protein YgfZ
MKELIVDHSDWGQVKVTGEDRVRFLQGMCTSNVETLHQGQWLRTSLLNAKGRLVSVFELVNQGDHLLLVCEPQLTDKTIETLGRYAIVDDVSFETQSGPMFRRWTDPASVWTAAPELGDLPGAAASAEEVEVRRIEAGLPSYGVDIGEDNFPFEGPLDRHIDYQKGCYIGQEPVARVHARGSANKYLRGLVVEGSEPIEVGAALAHPDKDPAGTVTSTAVSPDFGVIAMAYVNKVAWEPGTEVSVAGRKATVRELPLTAGQ